MRRTNAEQRYHQWGQLTHFHCTIARRGPPHLSGSHVSYVSLADVRKIWQCTTTPNPHVHKVSWVADASVYTFMFVLYAGIVHVQCYRGWCVDTGYVNTILGKLHKIKYAILTRHNTYLGHTGFARSFQRMESLFG